MARRYYSSTAVATTLSASASNSATSISVTALSGFPNTTPWTAIIDEGTAAEEVVEVTNVSGTTLTVTRGTDGTTGVSHNAGATFKHGVSARDFDEPNAHIANTSNPHAVTAAQAGAVALTAVGAASGVASLDSSGSVPVSQLGNALTSSIALGSHQFAADGSVLQNLPAQVPSAERLLKQAVWWIDAAHSSASGQSIKNLGWGGSALDAQCGSTGSADSNDPKYLDWSGENYVYLPGVFGNYLSVPDEAALDITGDIDIRVRVALDDWTPAAEIIVLSKYLTTGNQRSYTLNILTSGVVRLKWSADGAAITYKDSTAAPTVSDGEPLWLRATLDVSTGDVNFYTSADGSSWSPLGSTVTGSPTSIYSGTATLTMGAASKVYRAQILDGIDVDGTPVLDVDCSQITSGSDTSFAALTGQTVTINRSTSGRKSVAVTHPVWLFGTDDYMQVADNDLLDFGASDSFTVLAVVRQWATPTAGSQRLLSKKPADTAAAGYMLFSSTSPYVVFDLGDDSARSYDLQSQAWAGQLSTVTGVRDVGADTITAAVDGTGTPTTDATTGSLANSGPLRVGALGGGGVGGYADMEFIAAAVFRRALTSDEISTLNAYFQGRAI